MDTETEQSLDKMRSYYKQLLQLRNRACDFVVEFNNAPKIILNNKPTFNILRMIRARKAVEKAGDIALEKFYRKNELSYIKANEEYYIEVCKDCGALDNESYQTLYTLWSSLNKLFDSMKGVNVQLGDINENGEFEIHDTGLDKEKTYTFLNGYDFKICVDSLCSFVNTCDKYLEVYNEAINGLIGVSERGM